MASREPIWNTPTYCDDVARQVPFALLIPQSARLRQSRVRASVSDEGQGPLVHLMVRRPEEVYTIHIWESAYQRSRTTGGESLRFGDQEVAVAVNPGGKSLGATTEVAGTHVDVWAHAPETLSVEETLALCFPLVVVVEGELP